MNHDLFSSAVSPEKVGISSEAVLRIIDRLESERLSMHGIIIVHHGQIAAEGYWAPFTQGRFHRMYSVSKSIVSLAVGLMIDEGKLHLDDCVAKYFPDKLPENLHPYLAKATVRDLLMMATPHSENSYTKNDSDWAWTFFNKTPSHPAGTIFSYDTSGTVVLCSIVERISGQPFLEYLRPRLLDEIGFSKDAWCVKTPEGTSWGGSGVECTLRDMAKLAYVCLHNGRWGDKQLISEEYIKAATSKQIDNSEQFYPGYGYQIWCIPGGFLFNGMGSQYAFCFPEKDLIFACVGDTQIEAQRAMLVITDLVYRELVEMVSDGSIEENTCMVNTLKERINTLSLVPMEGALTSPFAQRISGVTYQMNENPMSIKSVKFTLDNGGGEFEYENATGKHMIEFGIGGYRSGKFPENHYFVGQIGVTPGIQFDCTTTAAWVEPHKLKICTYIIDECFGAMRMTFSFKGNEIAIFMTKAAEWFLDEYQGFAGGYAVESSVL